MEFTLQPFGETAPAIQIAGELTRAGSLLTIQFRVTGALNTLTIANPDPTPERRDLLWETTCLEFFLGVPGASNYFEFNLSPAGHWNVYTFDSYRAGMRRVETVQALPFTVDHGAEALTLTLQVDAELLAPGLPTFDVSVTSVIEERGGEVTYWALHHAGSDADFHQRESFIGTV